jgi:hypothetical protein
MRAGGEEEKKGKEEIPVMHINCVINFLAQE